MADIAKLGFSADTRALKDAKASLDALVPSATKAEKAAENFSRAAAGVTGGANGASAGIKSFQAAASGAGASVNNLTKAALSTGTAMGTVQRAAAGIKPTFDLVTAASERQITRLDILRGKWSALIERLSSVGPATTKAGSNLDRLGAAANDNINRLQSTPGNIAAQFQDIGVTAAAGMNPMLIALQQGTQLSSAMSGGVKNLLAGFKQFFSLTTILTVGLVGLVAAGLQMVDWMAVAEGLLNGIATGMDYAADMTEKYSTVLIYAAGVALLAFGPQIVASVVSLAATIGGALVSAISTATAAMIAFAIANPFTAIVIAIGVVIAAMAALNDAFGGAFTNILAMVKNVANGIIRFFANAFNFVLDRIEGMVNSASEAINSIFGAVGLDVRVGKVDFSGARVNANREDFVGDIAGWVGDKIGQGADWLRGMAGSLGAGETEKGGEGRSSRAGGISEAEKIAKAYQDLIESTEKRITALGVEAKALTMSGFAARGYRNEQELIAKALDQNIPLTEAVRQRFADLAKTLTDAEIAVEMQKITNAANDQLKALKDQGDLIGLTGLELEYQSARQKLVNEAIEANVIDVNNMTEATRQYVAVLGDLAMQQARQSAANSDASMLDEATKAHNERMIALRRESGELNLTGAALEKYRLETDLLIKAERGVASPETLENLRKQGYEYIELNEAIRKQREEIEHYRETYRGFFSTMIDGLREGQSVWQAFGNAVMSVVNRIIDRLLTMDGGVLDKLVGLGGSLLGLASPLVRDVNSTIAANPELFANGAAFGTEKFAQGGAFTNGIYSKPTLFKFANGTALGEMGEAGPEAVMPLKRGANGALGVQLHGAQQTTRVVVTTNDERFDAYVDNRSNSNIAASSPAIADAGGKVGNMRSAQRRKRTLVG